MSILESWKQSSNGGQIYEVARCQRPETRFTLKKLSAIFAGSEAWLDLSRLDLADKLAALADPDGAPDLAEFWETCAYMANGLGGEGQRPQPRGLEGRCLVDMAAERGRQPRSDVRHRRSTTNCRRSSGSPARSTGRVTVERILKSPATLVGISDAGAHLQTFAGGDYTSYFLAHWVREKG